MAQPHVRTTALAVSAIYLIDGLTQDDEVIQALSVKNYGSEHNRNCLCTTTWLGLYYVRAVPDTEVVKLLTIEKTS